MVELGGALLAPAFVDAHVHSTSTGLALLGLDLTGAASLAEALSTVEQAARSAGGRPLLGHGWDESRWPERRPPTTAELDRATYGSVVYLSRVDVHSAVVSSALLAAAPQVRTLPGWSSSGHLTRDAHHAARRVARDALSGGPAARRPARHPAAGGVARHRLPARARRPGPVQRGRPARARVARRRGAGPAGPAVLGGARSVRSGHRAGGRSAGRGRRRVRRRLDRLAHRLLHRAVRGRSRASGGTATCPSRRCAEHAVACTRAGLQAGFHAIGDVAVRTVADGFAAAARTVGERVFAAAGHRVEHLELVPPGAAAELGRLGVTGSVQPAFDALWGGRLRPLRRPARRRAVAGVEPAGRAGRRRGDARLRLGRPGDPAGALGGRARGGAPPLAGVETGPGRRLRRAHGRRVGGGRPRPAAC